MVISAGTRELGNEILKEGERILKNACGEEEIKGKV